MFLQFDLNAILAYLEDTQPPLHPDAAITRAQHRGWIEFGSSILNDLAGLFSAQTADLFEQKVTALEAKFSQLELQLGDGPHFAGSKFTLVDAVFGPVFRYFDTFDEISNFGILTDKTKTLAWREILAARPSVKHAVWENYPILLRKFLLKKNSHLSRLIT